LTGEEEGKVSFEGKTLSRESNFEDGSGIGGKGGRRDEKVCGPFCFVLVFRLSYSNQQHEIKATSLTNKTIL